MSLKSKIKGTKIYPVLAYIRKTKIINYFPRIFNAMSYYNKKYLQIINWGFSSNEDTNYTYDLTEDNLIYLAHTISIVCNKPFEIIMSFINEARNNKELSDFVIHKTKNSDLQCKFGRRLGWYAFARALKPRVIVETGVDKGHGAVLLCAAVLKNKNEGYEGEYIGTDINPEAGYLLDGIYKEAGQILYGDSIESLKKINKKIDLFINDSNHSPVYEYEEYQTIKFKLSNTGIILGDNSHCSNKLSIFSKENNRKFLFFHEVPKSHWYPGAGIGISY